VGLNRPLFFVALAALAMVVLGEIGVGIWGGRSSPEPPDPQAFAMSDADAQRVRAAVASAGSSRQSLSRPGVGISSLAFLDGLLLLSVVLTGLALVLPGGIHSRVQGVATLVVSLLLVMGDIAFLFATLGMLFTMIGLLLAVPFGTIAYLAIWGSFAVGAAAAALGVLLMLKLAFGVCLVLAHPRFIENKWLVMLAITSLVATVLLSILHGFPPRILASIADAVGGLVVGILAAIWALIFLIGSVVAVIKILRITRGSALVTSE
jgi:hypothetical protein